MTTTQTSFDIDYSKYGFKVIYDPVYSTKPGLDEDVVKEISKQKNEPKWMLEKRLKALEVFWQKKMPTFGPDLSELDFKKITYYIKPSERSQNSWDKVPEEIKLTFERLGIPEAERKFLGGVGAQYESEVVYHKIREDLKEKGIVFSDIETAEKTHPELVKKYFGTVVPMYDNKFAALNSAVWSGGSFIYVPKGVKVDLPLQAYFRINAENVGQFERTLIIADENSFVHYIEGCTAPIYSASSLHAAVVEIIALPGARVRYTTIQNWSNNVYNLVTKRAFAYENATVEWVDGNLGSKVTMKYPSVYLLGQNAKADILSVAFAGKNQVQDAGGKAVHLAKNTSSTITNKSLSKNGGRTVYRGLIKVASGAVNSRINVKCDAIILDDISSSDTIPVMDIREKKIVLGHEALTSKVDEESLFYLQSRGINQEEALSMLVQGFIEPFVKELPMEYAVELNRLISMSMEGSVG
ncbi:MAG: Fe-S cluster assembly protein SufB [Candidatus Micrarchaeota archaeon]|nr:Fe-S cluster assembly protein SufB [Candidatus Micrarchaeota archaeon]